ncbi:YesL family protein [Metabacillus endolithicus]|uniref:YesL family protein n=1 Tax=Metabacillus endolithicus TaxID=1535204 RepID=A0ABW5C4B6_9BACI|nr:DUF624 domain-containing protein [Metabacillus endolithicus]UPG62697.1 DUF624 domain-containing protein [Metabacillus endolithicus]
MESSSWMGGLLRVCDWISKLAYLNLLWLGFTVVGFGVLGFAPATVAMFTILRKWIMGESSIAIFPLFLSVYKSEFKKANILWSCLLVSVLFMYVDLVLINSMQGILHYMFLSFFVIAFILMLIITVYIFPVYVHFEGSILHYFKSAILLGASFPGRTILMMLSIGTGILISILFPGVGLLFFGSGISFALMYFSFSIFMTKLENTKSFK